MVGGEERRDRHGKQERKINIEGVEGLKGATRKESKVDRYT